MVTTAASEQQEESPASRLCPIKDGGVTYNHPATRECPVCHKYIFLQEAADISEDQESLSLPLSHVQIVKGNLHFFIFTNLLP